MPADAVAEIKSKLDIIDVVGGYVRLQKSGREYKGLCPFHGEKTPSFMVNQERQVFHCHGCGEGGDLLRFVEKIERLGFRETLELLAERAGIELARDGDGRERRDAQRRRKLAIDLHKRAQAYYEHVLWNTPAGEPGRALLRERGVSDELARQFGVGFAPSGGASGNALIRYLLGRKAVAAAAEIAEAGLAHTSDRGGPPRDRFRHRLLFPIRNERGETLAFGGRALGDAIPKYLNSPATAVYDKSQAIFGIDQARAAMQSSGVAVIVEGYFDVLAAHQAGVVNAVASSGTALTREQVRILSRHAHTVILCFDGDDAGRTAAGRAVDVVAAEKLECRICVLPAGFKDPDELVRRDPALFAQVVADAPREWQVLLDRAIGDEGHSLEARRDAADRVAALLARIPDAPVRQLYMEHAATRLDLEQSLVAEKVERVRRSGRPAPLRAEPPVVVTAPEDAVEEELVPPAPAEAYIARLALHRPALTAQLLAEHGFTPAEVIHAHVRQIVEVAMGLEPGVPFPVHRLGASEQRLAARLLVRSPAELQDPDNPLPVRQAVADSVIELRAAAKHAEWRAVQRELRLARDAGRTAEVEVLAARLNQLATERQQIRQGA